MRSLAYGLAAVLGLALPASADTTQNIQLAQAAQDSGAQSGAGTTAAQPGGQGGARTGATTTTRSSGTSQGTNARTEGRVSTEGRVREGRRDGDRTNIRANIRVGGDRDRDVVRSRFGTRTTIHSRAGVANEDVMIRRKHARRYVYNEPSTTVIRK